MTRRVAIAALIVGLLSLLPPLAINPEAANGIGITFKSSIYSTAAGVVTCSPTWTPTANELVIAFVETSYASAPVDPTGVTGHGLTYSALTLGASTFPTAGTHKLSAWVAKTGGSPTSVACTDTVSGTTTGCSAGELMFFRVVRDPTDGSDTLAASAFLVQFELTYRRAQ